MSLNSENKKMLNLGCGDRYREGWTNVDFISRDKHVLQYDLRKPLPFANNTFDVVYHSHILEHFTKEDAQKFINECFRVLKPGGIVRIAIPDLEIITKNYLKFLEAAQSGDKMSEANYDWTMLEMYDQSVRIKSGGEMATYLRQEDIPNKDFIAERMGTFTPIKKGGRQAQNDWKTLLRKILTKNSLQTLKNLRNKLTGQEQKQLGKFRVSGEIHQWMYDHFSLGRLLKNTGFDKIVQRSATESYIPEWSQYSLDSEPNGKIYKPDSLFMEAIKP